MNTPNLKTLTAALAMLALAACAASDTRPDGAANVRAKLTQLQSEPQLAGRAPVAMKDAEAAVRTAELPIADDQVELGRYRVVMADRKVDIARAQAQARFAEDERETLSDQRAAMRLDSRTREADRAHGAAEMARAEAAIARTDADLARNEADLARDEADLARADAARAQEEITELEGKTTDRGLVVTLGDVLFASGGARLQGGAPDNLDKLAGFLNRYPDRTVTIEGHTDSVGSDDSNRSLSLRRAESVKAYLIDQGVDSDRLNASGLGEGSPIADNASATGRQQNRRVEVVISNPPVASLRN